MKIDILHLHVNKLFIHVISHRKNCTMIKKLIFQKGRNNKKCKVYFHELELGGSKDDMVEILNCTETENEKKNSEQLLFAAFFVVMRIFGSIEP